MPSSKLRNADTHIALSFHESTKHSEISIRTSGHYLDWENKPSQFKAYEELEKVTLPTDFPRPDTNALGSISGRTTVTDQPVGLTELAEILFFSAGITRILRIGGERHYMRAASATGALYPIELYVVSGDLVGLQAGIYHFDPLGFGLALIRSGDFRQGLAAVSNVRVGQGSVTLVFSSVAWKNSWKYQARSYRHWFWDAGVIVANSLAVGSAMGVATSIVTGFVDDYVNRLLGLEQGREASILLMPVGKENAEIPNNPINTINQIHPRVRPLSRQEVEYPEMWELHEASTLRRKADVGSWLSNPLNHDPLNLSGRLIPVRPTGRTNSALSDVILQRGSSRRFARSPIGFEQVSDILRTSAKRLPVDYSDGQPLLDTFFIANMVDGLPSGAYLYHPEESAIEQLKTVESRTPSTYLSLEQPLFGDASIVFFLMVDLDRVLSKLGNRGYRVVQLEGGIMAGRIYLSAYALGLGASGSTFYDDAVTQFFNPAAKEKSPIIEVAVGVPAHKARSGSILPQLKKYYTTVSTTRAASTSGR